MMNQDTNPAEKGIPDRERERVLEEKDQDIVNITKIIRKISNQKSTVSEKSAQDFDEIRIINKLSKIADFYTKLINISGDNISHHVNFTGNIVFMNNYQDIDFIISFIMEIPFLEQFSMFILDVSKYGEIIRSIPKFFEKLIQYFSLHRPSLLFVKNNMIDAWLMDFFVEKSFKDDNLACILFVEDKRMIPNELMRAIDFLVDLDSPTLREREFFLKRLFPSIIDVNFSIIAKEMQDWTWNDITHFAKQIMLETTTGEKNPSLTLFMNLLVGDNDLEKFIPPSIRYGRDQHQHSRISQSNGGSSPITKKAAIKAQNEGIENITKSLDLSTDSCDPFREQLFQLAAAKDYNIIIRILERMENGIYNPADRAYLARYPILLQEDIKIVKQKLDAARSRIEILNERFKQGSGE